MVDPRSLARGGKRLLGNLLLFVLRFRIFSLDLYFPVTDIYLLHALQYDLGDICVTACICTGMFVAGAVLGVGGCWYVKIVAQRGMCTRRWSTPCPSFVVGGGHQVISHRLG